MNQDLQRWLQHHGHHNVFAFFNEEECRELLGNLEQQLALEEQREQAARELVTQSFYTLSHSPHDQEPLSSPRLPSAGATPSLAEPAPSSGAAVQAGGWSRGLTWATACALGVMLLVGWSSLLYRYGYSRGQNTPPSASEVACSSPTPRPTSPRDAQTASTLPQVALASKAHGSHQPLSRPAVPMLIQPQLRVEVYSPPSQTFPWSRLTSPSPSEGWQTASSVGDKPASLLSSREWSSRWSFPPSPALRLSRKRSAQPLQQRDYLRLSPLLLSSSY